MEPGIKVIFAGGYMYDNVKSELLRAGSKDYLQKPYNIDILLEKIRDVLSRGIG